MSKKTPQIRFKGFTDDWEERKLGDTETHFTDGNYGESYPSAKDMSDKANGIPFLRGSDFSNGYLDSSNANYIKPEKHAELTSGHIKQDDIVLAVRGSLGTLGYATKENEGWNINSQLAILRTNKSEISGMFLIQYLLGSKGQKEIFSRNTGTALKQLPIKQLKDIPVPVPTLLEQQKIGNFFKELDSTIALHQRKLDLLKEQKKGFLQKMFPKNGAKVPELRFAGFTDDWEERKLGDVVGEIQSGNRLPKDSLTNGDVPYVVAQTKNDGVFKKIARGTLDYNGNPMKLFPGNSISFSIDNPEAMFYRNAEFYTSNIMRVIHEDHLTHEQYVFILENMKRFIRGYDWSRKFSGPVVSNLEYLQPSEEEQQKIGSFFKQLDDTIALHQRKLDLLKEQKKGFLQKMFVS